MLAKIHSACVIGMDACEVDVEVDISGGLPAFSVIGMPDTAIRESRDRIRSAIKNSGLEFPVKKITVNLSPADIKKEGAGFDLPIALGILAASGTLSPEETEGKLFCGELSLNGKLKPFRGALPMAITFKHKYQDFILPSENSKEAANVREIRSFGASSLTEVIAHIKGYKSISPQTPAGETPKPAGGRHKDPDFRDVKGQEHVKRGLEVAASGNHNALLLGPPGSGKSMLAKRFPWLLPGLSREESLEITRVYSIAGENIPDGIMLKRPYRSPHHTISSAAMAGGGSWPLPGEITLSHNGVLFLDEFPEFRRDVLETLRQPLESGEITITRVERSVRYPARFLLIAAMNPCPCGHLTDPKKQCRCTPIQIQRYLSKVSGPLLDRIDIHLEVPRLEYDTLSRKRAGESTEDIRSRVLRTREIQNERLGPSPRHASYNAYMTPDEVEKHCALTDDASRILKSAILELGLSARAYDKILKIARTVADMETSEKIDSHHISEAIGYRCLDRNLWG